LTRNRLFDLAFAGAGGLLLLFIILPLATILFSTSPQQFWQALTDAEAQRSSP